MTAAHRPRARAKVVTAALIRQWRAVEKAMPTIDLDAPSRIEGWRNREVLAHLSVQPLLVARFIAESVSAQPARVSLESNLAGTRTLSAIIDSSAREAAARPIRFADNIAAAVPVIAAADLAATVTTFQGPIQLADYLVTRCVEAVVHGRDLVEPVAADAVAFTITSEALVSVLARSDPELVARVAALPIEVWVDAATGRVAPPPGLESALPVMQ